MQALQSPVERLALRPVQALGTPVAGRRVLRAAVAHEEAMHRFEQPA